MFGDNGMISVVICRPGKAGEWEIDTWLMSCRVLRRRVEHMVLREILEHARAAGIQKLIGHLYSDGTQPACGRSLRQTWLYQGGGRRVRDCRVGIAGRGSGCRERANEARLAVRLTGRARLQNYGFLAKSLPNLYGERNLIVSGCPREPATEASDPGLAATGSRVMGYEAFWEAREGTGKEGVDGGMGAGLCRHHDRTFRGRRALFQPFRGGEVYGLAGWKKNGDAALKVVA